MNEMMAIEIIGIFCSYDVASIEYNVTSRNNFLAHWSIIQIEIAYNNRILFRLQGSELKQCNNSELHRICRYIYYYAFAWTWKYIGYFSLSISIYSL